MKNNTTTQLIAKEGWKYVAFAFAFFVSALSFDFLSWVFFVIFILSAYIFRNPERLPAEDDDMAVISPCDGTIVNISKAKDSDGDEYIKVEIQKSLLDASLLRAPIGLNIEKTSRRHGLFLSTNSELNDKLGENAIVTCSSNYSKVLMKIKAGLYSRKIDLFKTVGPLKSTQRLGLLIDGSVELFLALDTRVKVSIGDNVKAGQSVLGYFATKIK